MLILAKANPLSRSSDTVDLRYVFNRFSTGKVRSGVDEEINNVVNNCKNIFIFGKITMQRGNVSTAETWFKFFIYPLTSPNV